MPEFAIVLFQTDGNNQLKHSSFFDHCKVKNIFFRNGRNETFPNEAWNLDIDEINGAFVKRNLFLNIYNSHSGKNSSTQKSWRQNRNQNINQTTN